MEKYIDMTSDDGNYSVRLMFRTGSSRATKTRIYVTGEDEVDFTEAHMQNQEHGFPARGTDKFIDNIFDKLNRQEVKNQRKVIDFGLSFFPNMAREVSVAGVKFSRQAGCSCGCSAGFIVGKTLYWDGNIVNSVWVEKK